MNTNTAILKWDVTVQKGLMALNSLLILATIFAPGFLYVLLPLQFIEGLYQLISSGMHLHFPHKSIGFIKFRLIHFWGSLAYLIILGFMLAYQPDGILMAITALLIPQCIFYAYFALCYTELKQLQNREFHILR
jgi:hypothetical protein